MLAGNDFSALIQKNALPIIESAKALAAQFVFPDNTTRNYNAQLPFIEGMNGLDFILYCDPQTSGGLLFSVAADAQDEVDELLNNAGQFYAKIGSIIESKEKKITFE